MRRLLKVRTLVSLLGLFVVSFAFPRAAFAANCVWTGGAGNSSWSVAGNWVGCGGGGVPINGDTVTFPAGADQSTTNNNIGPLTLASMTISGVTSGNLRYNVTGSALTLSALILSAPPDSLGQGAQMNLALTMAAAGTISNTGANTTVHFIEAVTLVGGLTLTTGASSQLTFDNVISGVGPIAKLGAGEVFLQVANTFTGSFVVVAGTAVASNQNALGATGAANDTVVNNGGALRLFNPGGGYVLPESLTIDGPGTGSPTDGALTQIDSTISVSGPVVLTGFAVVYTHPTATLTLSGPISGGVGTLSKQGTGTLIFTGNNTHFRTDHEDGNLFINGNQPGVETDVIGFGDFLGGTGTTGETSSFTGILSPGTTATAPGILNTGDFVLSNGTYNVQLNGGTAGAGYDQINVAGSVTLSGDLTGTVGFAPVNGQQFTIIQNDGADPVFGTLSGLAEGAAFVLGGQPFSISYVGGTGNDVVIIFNPAVVPTMPTIILVVLALGLMTIVTLRLRSRVVA